MSPHEMLLSVAEGIRRIPVDEGSAEIDIVIQKVVKTQDTGRVIVSSSPGAVWSADRESS